MEVLPMPPQFNVEHIKLALLQAHAMAGNLFTNGNVDDSPPEKRAKPDAFPFPCFLCSDVFSDPNALCAHMQDRHPEIYTDVNQQQPLDQMNNDYDDEYSPDDQDREDEDENDEFDYSSIMEPICELGQPEEEITPTLPATNSTPAVPPPAANHPISLTREQQKMQAKCLQQQLQHLQLLHQIQMQQQPLVVLQKKHLESNASASPFDQLMKLPDLNGTQQSLSSNEDEEEEEDDGDSRSTTSTSSNGFAQNGVHPLGRGRRSEEMYKSQLIKSENGPSLFQCSQCEQSFTYSGDLARHVRSHTQNKPFQCSICDKTFTHIGSLNTHIRIHSGEKPYKCKICSKAFTQSSSLMVHLKSHSVKKPFQCEICDKGFVNSSSLVIHMKAHAEADPFKCDECDKTFKQAQMLEEHRAIHLNLPMYQCSICRNRFRQPGELVQHMKSHTGAKPFQCSICEKSFTQPGSLSTHMRIHTGEKPFQCKECPKSFTQASSLSMHKKTHVTTTTPTKNVQCKICRKQYTHQTYLTKHMACHEAYACPICSQKFEEPISMFQHISRDHALGKHRKLKCWECSEQFTSDPEFMEHLRQHTEHAEQRLLQRAAAAAAAAHQSNIRVESKETPHNLC